MASSAYDYALNLLAQRAYTVRNLTRKLVQKGFEPEERTAAVERLLANGYLDDQKFALEFARQRLVAGGASARRVQQDLIKRGIGADVARSAANAVIEEEVLDFSDSVDRLARKKMASLGDLDPSVKRRRVFGFLARKGYDLDDINRTLARIFP